jgi:hypothetical protein
MNTNIRYKNKLKKTKKYKKKYSSFYTRKRGGSLNEVKEVKKEDKKEDKKDKEENKDKEDKKEDKEEKDKEEDKEDDKENDKDEKEDKEAIEQIKEEVQDEKKSNILGKSSEIAQSVAANAIENVGNLIGIDLDDPNLIEENKEKIKQISENAAEIGSIVAESVEPFTKPLIDKTIKAGTEAATKIGEAGVKVALNTATEIPGVGIIVGSIRSLGNIGDAVVSSVNAGSEVITSASDTINQSVKNFDRLIKEKEDVLNRTKASIDEFTGGFRTKKNRKNKRGTMNRKTRKVF